MAITDDHPNGQRKAGMWGKLERAWRDFVPAIAIMIAAWAVFLAHQKVDHAELRADHATILAERNLQGRKAAVAVTCSAISAVIDAGRATIGASINVSPKLERNLRRLGYPSKHQRQKNAKVAARRYATSISRAVARETGTKGLVHKDGTLNCNRLKKASHAG